MAIDEDDIDSLVEIVDALCAAILRDGLKHHTPGAMRSLVSINERASNLRRRRLRTEGESNDG